MSIPLYAIFAARIPCKYDNCAVELGDVDNYVHIISCTYQWYVVGVGETRRFDILSKPYFWTQTSSPNKKKHPSLVMYPLVTQ